MQLSHVFYTLLKGQYVVLKCNIFSPRLARTHSNIDDQPIKSEKAVRFSCESIVNQILLR